MKLHYFSFLLLFCHYFVFSQDYRFGKVSEADLKESVHPLDPEAEAAILYREESIYFRYINKEGFRQFRNVRERVKIYNSNGFKWATNKIVLYDETKFKNQEVVNLKGYTYRLVNGKVDKTKLTDDGKFLEDAREYWNVFSFTMPNIQDGCIIEYEYDIQSPYLYISPIDLQSEVPINRLEVSISTPEYFIYNKHFNQKASFTPRLEYSTTKRHQDIVDYTMPEGYFTKSDRTHYTLDYTENKITIQEDNIPALINEPFVDNLRNYSSFIRLELNAVELPYQAPEFYSSDWETITHGIYFNEDFGSQISKEGYFKTDLDQIIGGVSSPVSKIGLIYNYIRSKVRWNGEDGYLTDQGVKKAYEDGSGNVAEINLMLVSMLKYAGLDANPVLISTKENGIPILPTRFGFNYVVCHVLLNGEPILLDAADIFAVPNVLPTRTLNWQGRLVKPDGTSRWIDIQAKYPTRDMTMVMAKINENLAITGNVKNQLNNHGALNFRHSLSNVDSNEHTKFLEEGRQGLEVIKATIENKNDDINSVKLDYDFSITDLVEDIGGKLYFSPMLFLSKLENQFTQDKRNYPIDFQFNINAKYIFNIELPVGYRIASLPTSEKFQFNINQILYTYLINGRDNNLTLTVDFDRNQSYINPDSFLDLKDFYARMATKQEEKVVLEKI